VRSRCRTVEQEPVPHAQNNTTALNKLRVLCEFSFRQFRVLHPCAFQCSTALKGQTHFVLARRQSGVKTKLRPNPLAQPRRPSIPGLRRRSRIHGDLFRSRPAPGKVPISAPKERFAAVRVRPRHQSQPNFNNGRPHFGQGVLSFAS
jgi:hypothetical protein